MAQAFVFDLTEVLLALNGRLRHYGIMRVVQQIAIELYKQAPETRFAVFSFGHQTMFEVVPTQRTDGTVDLNVPGGLWQNHQRRRFYTCSTLRDVCVAITHPVTAMYNRWRWARAAGDLKPLDMNGQVLVSCTRPKLIVHIADALDGASVRFDLVPLLHDMIPLHFPERPNRHFACKFVNDNRVLLARSRAVLTNSCFTRDDISDLQRTGVLPDAPGGLFPVPLVHECRADNTPVQIALPQRPYVMAVGCTLGRKNLEVIFDALDVLRRTGQIVPALVLAGQHRKRTARYLSSHVHPSIRAHVIIHDQPGQADLIHLYTNAAALILPSRMEGWGLPAGEALWCGTPALCAKVPALVEVCGELGLYFDPDRPGELARLIARLLSDAPFAKDLKHRIATHKGRLRTWAHAACDMRRAVGEIAARAT